MPTDINSFVADARRRFRASGIPRDEAALDARLLAQHVLAWDAARLMTHGDQIAPADFADAFEALVARRVAREPLAYITGTKEFWNLAIEVTPAVLVPRPETELLIEAALEYFDRGQAIRILDVCTGSGCLAVCLGREFVRATIAASDNSPAAVEIAQRNIARYSLGSRVKCVCGDLMNEVEGPFDLIVANPPYIPAGDAKSLQPEVREFEPPAALFAGSDGMQIIRRLVKDAPAALAADGILIFEFGAGQDDAVESVLCAEKALAVIEVKRDLQDIPRAAIAQKRRS